VQAALRAGSEGCFGVKSPQYHHYLRHRSERRDGLHFDGIRLVWLALGLREAGIVFTAIPVTLALTLATFAFMASR